MTDLYRYLLFKNLMIKSNPIGTSSMLDILSIDLSHTFYNIGNFYKNKTAEPEQTSMRTSVNDWKRDDTLFFFALSLFHLIVNNRQKVTYSCLTYTHQRSLDGNRQATLWLRCKYNMDALVSIGRSKTLSIVRQCSREREKVNAADTTIWSPFWLTFFLF